MVKAKRIYPLWYQYEVVLSPNHPEQDMWSGGLVNVIVFAASDDAARSQCGLYVSKMNLEIKELKRSSTVGPVQLENTGPVFKALYKKAEQAGIAARFDGWKITSEE